jgi:hypothetical protein
LVALCSFIFSACFWWGGGCARFDLVRPIGPKRASNHRAVSYFCLLPDHAVKALTIYSST